MTNPVDDLRERVADALRDVNDLIAVGTDGRVSYRLTRAVDAVMAIVAPVLEHQRSWWGLMEFLDEQYPGEVFDGFSGDPGPRMIVAALDRYDAWALKKAVDDLILATVKAERCIPDGEHQAGCVVYDGAKVRTELHGAVAAIQKLTGAAVEGGTP